MPHGPYVVNFTNTAVTAAITLIQIKAGATNPLQLIEVRFSQSSSTTSAQQRIQIAKQTAAGTVTSFTPLLENPSDGAANAAGGTSATGVNCSSEGTYTDIYLEWDFNVLTGFLWQPALEDRIWVPAAGIIGIRFPTAPGSSTTYDGQAKFLEYP
jgi:hypothetical protein